MKILVLGGNRFLGRHFIEEAHERYHIIVFNSGIVHTNNVRCIKGNRIKNECESDQVSLETLKNEKFDAVVDFCGIYPGSVKQVLEVFKENIEHYIFISSVDAYIPQVDHMIKEDEPIKSKFNEKDGGSFKAILEKELVYYCNVYNIKYTIFRPTCIYGKYSCDTNAPDREKFYFDNIWKSKMIYHPKDA